MLYGVHAAQIALAVGAAILIRGRVVAVSSDRLVASKFIRLGVGALRDGDDTRVGRLVELGAGTALGTLLAAAHEAALTGRDARDAMRVPLMELRFEVLRGFRAARAMASVSTAAALVGAMAHWFSMRHEGLGVFGEAAVAIRDDAMRGSALSMALGLGTAAFIYGTRGPLRDGAIARRSETLDAAERFAAAVEDRAGAG